MHVELSAASVITLTRQLTACAQQHRESPEIGQHLLEVLLSCIPGLQAAALYRREDQTITCFARQGEGLPAENIALADYPALQAAFGGAAARRDALAAAPVMAEETVLAVHGAAPLDDRTLALVEVAAGVLALALAHHQPGLQGMVEERSLLRTLIDHIPDYIFVKDRQSRMLINNRAHAVDVLGAASPEEVVGKTDFDFFPEELARFYYEEEQKLMATGQAILYEEYPSEAPDGTKTWHLNTKVPLRDTSGEVVGLVGIVRDITELKQRELERDALFVAEQQQRLLAETLADISLTLASQTEFDAVLDEILQYIQRLTPSSQGAGIALLHGNSLVMERLRLEAGLSTRRGREGEEVPIASLPVSASLFQNPQPELRESVGLEERNRLQPLGLDWVGSYVVLPIVLRERPIGLIWVASQQAGAFKQDDIQILQPLANAAAIALENAQLLRAAQERADRQQRLNEISVHLQQSTDMAALLEAALQELGSTLGAKVGRVRLRVPAETPVVIPGESTASGNGQTENSAGEESL
ncbi:MAG: hypothetical protein Kow0077_25810 [Anaerolineae bacterium]